MHISRYISVPCLRGHFSERYPSGRCIECHKESAKARRKSRSERFFTGEPCKNGHISWRYASGICIECSKASRERNKEAIKMGIKDWKRRNPKKRARGYRRQRLKELGLTEDTFDALLTSQDIKCGNMGCRSPHPDPNNWNIDHDHKTGKVRGILCFSCNLALGHMKDNPARLRGLADYLECAAIETITPIKNSETNAR